MGRKAGFTDTQVFVWLAEHMAQAPGVTVQQVSKGTGVSVGSLYHRFGSMEGLLAEAWIWSHRIFREGLESALQAAGLKGPVRGAVWSLRFATEAPAAANLYFSVPERFLVREGASEELRKAISDEQVALMACIKACATAVETDEETVEIAVLQIPAAIVRKYLPDSAIPEQAELYVKKTCRMVLAHPMQPASLAAE